jgi:hypothetical protein
MTQPITTGVIIGSLTAVAATGTRRSGSNEWACRCECGALVHRTEKQLTQALSWGKHSACSACRKKRADRPWGRSTR